MEEQKLMDFDENEKKILEIREEGEWKRFSLTGVRRIEKTSVSDEPQLVFDFTRIGGGEEEKYSLWSRLRISPRSKIGSFLEAVTASTLTNGMKIDVSKLIGKEVYGLVGIQKFSIDGVPREKKTILRFAPIR